MGVWARCWGQCVFGIIKNMRLFMFGNFMIQPGYG